MMLMEKSKPQKRFRSFVFDSSIPGGIRFLLVVNLVLVLYFFIISVPFSLMMYLNPSAAALTHLIITVYGWFIIVFLLISIYSLWSGRFAPKFWSYLSSLSLMGYGGIWIYAEVRFLPLGLVFITIGAISLLYIATRYDSANHRGRETVRNF